MRRPKKIRKTTKMSFDYEHESYYDRNRNYEKMRDMRYALSLCASAGAAVEIIKALDFELARALNTKPADLQAQVRVIYDNVKKLSSLLSGG